MRRNGPPGGGPTSSRSPFRSGRPWTPPIPLGRCVEALPSTGERARRRGCRARSGRPIASRRRDDVARRERRRGPERDRRAEVGSADRDDGGRIGPERAAAQRHLDPGRSVRIADEPVADAKRRPDRRRRTRRRRARRSRAPEVLHRRQHPGVDDGERHVRVCSCARARMPGSERIARGPPRGAEPEDRGPRGRSRAACGR